VATARAAGANWEDLITERVLQPLGMTRTSPRVADFYADPNHASIHAIEAGVATPRFERQPDPQSPAGGISSTAHDMANWLILQLNEGRFGGRQVVDAAALAETHRPQIVRGNDRHGRPVFYGLGWNVDYRADGIVRISHAGAFFVGTRTQVVLLPEFRFGIVVLTNAFPTGIPEAVTEGFIDILIKGEPSEDYLAFHERNFAAMVDRPDYVAPAEPSPAMAATAYAGRYVNDYYGDADVVTEGDRLTLLLGPDRRPFALSHFDRDAFLFDFIGLGDEGQREALVAFSSANGTRADALTIDFLDANGQGTFTRAGD
jgi:CubicO group peptidase (beta-lactamase class C family)